MLMTRQIGARLLLLLLIAESPLVVVTVGLALRNDRLQANDAISRVAAAETDALTQLRRQLRAATAIAGAAGSLPRALVQDRPNCDRVLTTLLAADRSGAGAITLTDASGATLCATAGASGPVSSARAGTLARLASAGGGLGVIATLGPRLSGAAMVTLAPYQAELAAPYLSPVYLWARVSGAWIAAGPAPPDSLPLPGVQLTRPPRFAWRQNAVSGHASFYTVFLPPGGIGAPGDLLLAASDARAAAAATRRDFIGLLLDLAVFFAAEFVAVAAGVSLVASRPLARLNQAVDRWRAGDGFSGIDPHDGPQEIAALSQSFAQATSSLDQRERELQAAISQQELLIQEIHHRVKNNLQIIASLLNLQASRIKAPEARAEFQSARDRVRALATLHRHLYAHGDLHLIDLRAFFAELCSQLFQSLDEPEGDRIALTITAPDVTILSDQAVPIALIVTETVGNAIKYAFPPPRRGTIRVTFDVHDGGHATLSVQDDGVGIGPGDSGAGRGLGLQLVRGFARQLGARLTISTEGGTCYRLDMEIERNRANTIALGRAAA